jgi:hypothetical protein
VKLLDPDGLGGFAVADGDSLRMTDVAPRIAGRHAPIAGVIRVIAVKSMIRLVR